jgi:carboxyl-terminal processing protease
MKKNLKQLGYNPGPLDGLWRPKTQHAIRKFQQANRLPVTDKLDDKTLLQLLQPADGYQKQTYSLLTA